MAINPDQAIRRTSRAQTTGGEVRLIDSEHPDAPAEVANHDPRWIVACEHDNFIAVSTRREGRRAAVSPESFCDECVEIARSRGWTIEFDEVAR